MPVVSNTGTPCSSYTIIATGVGEAPLLVTSLYGELGSSMVLAMASLRWSCKMMSSTLSSSCIAWSARSLNALRIASTAPGLQSVTAPLFVMALITCGIRNLRSCSPTLRVKFPWYFVYECTTLLAERSGNRPRTTCLCVVGSCV